MADTINIGNMPIQREWKRPEEFDPLRRWIDAVGRVADLRALHEHLQNHHSVTVVGMPGVGKSTLASLFARNYAAEFPGGVLWAELGYAFRDAAQCQPILNGWARWAYGGDAQIVRDTNQQFDPAAVHALLAGHGPLLVVIDDVWRLEAVGPLRRALPLEARVVTTTRDTRIASTMDYFPLDVLIVDEALLLLRASLPDISDVRLEQLAHGLGRHAQALAIAAGDIQRRGSRERREQAIDILLARMQSGQGFGDLPQLDQHDRQGAVEVALKSSYDDIGTSATMGADYQGRFRALGGQGPSEASFSTTLAASLWGDELDAAADFLDVLRDRSLVRQVADSRWALHTLVHNYARALLHREAELQTVEKYREFVIQTAMVACRHPLKDWVQLVPDLPHVQHVGNTLLDTVRDILGDLDLLAQPTSASPTGTTNLSEDNRTLLTQSLTFSVAVAPYVLRRPELGIQGKQWLSLGLVSARALNEQQITAIFLRDLALVNYQHGNLSIALEYSKQALHAARELGNQRDEATLLNNIGGVYRDTGQSEQALEPFSQSLLIHREMGHQLGEAATLNNMALTYQAMGQLPQALELLGQVLSITRGMDDKDGEATTLSNMGMVYRGLGQPQQALELYQRALPIVRELGDQVGEAATLNNMGMAHYDLGQLSQSLDLYEQALLIVNKVGNQGLEAVILHNMGNVYHALRQPQKAMELFDQALPMAHAALRRMLEATILNSMAEVYHGLKELPRALELFKQALAIMQELGNRASEASILSSMMLAHHALGQKEKMVERFQQALLIRREMGDRTNEANILHNMGILEFDLGESHQSLRLFVQALAIMRELGNRTGEATVLVSMGEVYRANRRPRWALDWYRQVISIRHELENKKMVATALNNMGLAYLDLNLPQQSLELFEQAVPMNREAGDREGELVNVNNMAAVYRHIGLLQRALELEQEVMAIRREIGNA